MNAKDSSQQPLWKTLPSKFNSLRNGEEEKFSDEEASEWNKGIVRRATRRERKRKRKKKQDD